MQHVVSELYRCGPPSLKWFPQQCMQCTWEKYSNLLLGTLELSFSQHCIGVFVVVCDVTHTKHCGFSCVGVVDVGVHTADLSLYSCT